MVKSLFLEIYFSPLWWPLLFLVSLDVGMLYGTLIKLL